jgi:ArsR family transcriptional regulator
MTGVKLENRTAGNYAVPVSSHAIHEIWAELFRALGHPLRMEIMDLLRSGPMSVTAIALATGRPAAAISQNLSVLRNAGYRVANAKLMRMCDLMREALADQLASASKLAHDLDE